MIKKIGILTCGGDCPGLNAVIRGAVKLGLYYGVETIGFLEGYKGLLENRFVKLDQSKIDGIIYKGGTIIKSNNGTNTFAVPEINAKGEKVFVDHSEEIAERLKREGFDGLIIIGGDGSLKSARDYMLRGVNVVGVPKTIDNDVPFTDVTFGFNTAVEVATEAIDRLHTTADSHGRIMVLEVMGRYAGWIALSSGIAGGADTILIPEIPYDFDKIVEKINKRREMGKYHTIIVVAEGAKPKDGTVSIREIEADKAQNKGLDSVKLGGVGAYISHELELRTGREVRYTNLGYIQRGGDTCPYDRILSTEFGAMAMQLCIDEKFGRMVTLLNGKLQSISLNEVAGVQTQIGTSSSNLKLVDLNGDLVKTARRIGVCLGD